VQEADRLVPLAPSEGTADGWLETADGVFFSHAGEQKYGVVSFICKEFRDKHPGVKVFLDEANVVPGAWSLPAIGQACRTAAVGAYAWVAVAIIGALLSVCACAFRYPAAGAVHLLSKELETSWRL
jgi:hypothetical protein